MTDDKIKSGVFKKLWMFKKDCPWIEAWNKDKMIKFSTDGTLPQFITDMLLNTEEHQLMVILTKILPAEIFLNGVTYSKGQSDRIQDNGDQLNRRHFCLFYTSRHWLFQSIYHANIWQSILFLLDAIKSKQEELESHKDRDKMVFRWGGE